MAQVSDLRNTLADRLWVLFEAQATITGAVVAANRHKGTEPGWLRGVIANLPIDQRRIGITFDRFTNTLGEATTTFDDVRRTHGVVITLNEPLPKDPGTYALLESAEQTLLLAGNDLGLPTLVESVGGLNGTIRPTRDGEHPNPGRVIEMRLTIVTVQSYAALAALTP